MKRGYPYSKAIILGSMVVFLALASLSCDERLDYVRPFRWGSMAQIFHVEGPVKTLVDSIYPVQHLITFGVDRNLYDQKKELLRVEVGGNGYPTLVGFRGVAEEGFRFPLDTLYQVDIFIHPTTHGFEAVKTTIGDQTYAGEVYYPSERSFLIKSITPQGLEAAVMSMSFSGDNDLLSYAYWKQNRIENRFDYSWISSNQKRLTLKINNTTSKVGTLDLSPRLEVEKVQLTDPAIAAKVEYTYTYSNSDAQGNYKNVLIKRDGIPIAKIERTITYFH